MGRPGHLQFQALAARGLGSPSHLRFDRLFSADSEIRFAFSQDLNDYPVQVEVDGRDPPPRFRFALYWGGLLSRCPH